MKQSRSYQNCLSKHSLPLSFTLFLLSLICQTPSWFSISAGLIITFHSHPSSLRGSNYTHTHPHTHTHTPIALVTHTTWWSLSWGRTSIMKAPRVCVCVCVCVCVVDTVEEQVWSKPTGLSSLEVTGGDRRSRRQRKSAGSAWRQFYYTGFLETLTLYCLSVSGRHLWFLH